MLLRKERNRYLPAVKLKPLIQVILAHKTPFSLGRLRVLAGCTSKPLWTLTARLLTASYTLPKTPITAADLLNDRVLPYFSEHDIPMLRILTDRGTEFCGKVEHHDYELYLAASDIEHTKTKARHPQTNGICERFHKTILNEFYQVTFRKKVYTDLTELQKDLDLCTGQKIWRSELARVRGMSWLPM